MGMGSPRVGARVGLRVRLGSVRRNRIRLPLCLRCRLPLLSPPCLRPRRSALLRFQLRSRQFPQRIRGPRLQSRPRRRLSRTPIRPRPSRSKTKDNHRARGRILPPCQLGRVQLLAGRGNRAHVCRRACRCRMADGNSTSVSQSVAWLMRAVPQAQRSAWDVQRLLTLGVLLGHLVQTRPRPVLAWSLDPMSRFSNQPPSSARQTRASLAMKQPPVPLISQRPKMMQGRARNQIHGQVCNRLRGRVLSQLRSQMHGQIRSRTLEKVPNNREQPRGI